MVASRNSRSPARQAGITLIELIITLAVFIVVVTTAGPAISKVLRDNRLIAQTNSLLGDISFTRSEAIKRGARVTICQSDDQASCSNDKDAWHKGWIVVDAAGNLLRVHGPLRGGTILTFSRGSLSYKGDGTSTGLATGTFTLCSAAGGKGRTLVVGPTGRVRKSTTTCS